MVGSSGGVGASSGSSSAGNDRAGGGKNDRNNSNDKSSKSGSSSSNGSGRTSHSGNHESERAGIGGSKKDSFDSAMSAAANTADRTAEKAARDSFAHANEFSGLTSEGGSIGQEHASEFAGLGPSGNASLNSHRGYGPDVTLAGGIDRDVNAGLEQQQGKTGGFDRPGGLDIAGYAVAGAAGGFAFAEQHANIKSIKTVTDTLGRHPTSNLPVSPGSTVLNRDYVTALTKQKTAADALAAHPAKGGAMRDILEDAAGKASRYGRTATGIGLAFDPVVTGITAAVTIEGSWTEKATAAVVEGAKRADNAAASFVAGTGAAALTMAGTSGLGTLAAPAVGLAAGVTGGEAYARTPADSAFDSAMEAARPAVQAGFDAVDSFINAQVDVAESAAEVLGEGWDRLSNLIPGEEGQ